MKSGARQAAAGGGAGVLDRAGNIVEYRSQTQEGTLSFRLLETVWNYAWLLRSGPSSEGTVEYHELLPDDDIFVNEFRLSQTG